MDISNINDLPTLKSMAYDEIAKKELAERNLTTINGRISSLMALTPEEAKNNLPKVGDEPGENKNVQADGPVEDGGPDNA